MERIDSDPEVKASGRSAFIRRAVRDYLDAREQERVDERLRDAFADAADSMLQEVDDMLSGQEWPEP